MRLLPRILALFVLSAMTATARAGDVIDRIVATVNGHVILQSDWDDAIRFEALVEGRPLEQVGEQDRGRALDRLIDQELLHEQAQGNEVAPVPAEEVQARIADIRKEHAAADALSWQAALAQYGFDEKQFEVRVARDLAMLRQVEARIRPTVQIAPQTIESYYRETLLPQLRKSGAQDVPLAEVSGKIREILTQQKVNELFGSWLQTLRSESKITGPRLSSGFSAPGGQGQ
ncbi:MAG TPA: SurA N-terminal domain-containing protein [Terriglobales bacterium]|nr:SurA N-terminal domain-containing protein [Terriglobales bacterium]